jgi:uncharacterized protein
MNSRTFLTAEWRYLVMLNYEIDPALLRPFVPRGTELDAWRGRTFASIVGFLFLNTKVCGLPIPFHRNFEEINLRFYVRREAEDGWRRGVVFVKEIVPRFAIAAVARGVYNERYVARRMSHRLELEGGTLRRDASLSYSWREAGGWNYLRATIVGDAREIAAGSEEEFITEHYWGYAAQRDGGAVEYRVEHPRWRVWQVRDAAFECDTARVYGPQFVESLSAAPSSAFVAAGSAVSVRRGRRLAGVGDGIGD